MPTARCGTGRRWRWRWGVRGRSHEAARALAEDLDKRGYLPPDPPMTRTELETARRSDGVPVPPELRAILWDVLGCGVPLPTALVRAGAPPERRPLLRRRAQRWIKAIGWGEVADDEG